MVILPLMKRERTSKAIILLLISILTIGMGYRFVPHHHHEGRICIETNDSEKEHSSHEENFHSEISVYDIPKTDFKFSILFFDIIGAPLSEAFSSLPLVHQLSECYTPRAFIDVCEGYFKKLNRLRGSPVL